MYSIILEKVLLSLKLTYQSFAVDQMSIDEVRLIFKSSWNLKINEIWYFRSGNSQNSSTCFSTETFKVLLN